MRSFSTLSSAALIISGALAAQLHPVTVDMITGDSTGPSKRAQDQSNLDLQNEETFYWAGANSYLADLKVKYPGQNEHVVAMEKFEGMLSAIDCTNPDLMMDFITKEDFEYAKSTWGWVNKHPEHKFIMIANYPGCGPDGERQPYVVSDINYDNSKYKVMLKAEQKDWDEVAHTYHLHVGKAPQHLTKLLMARDTHTFDVGSDFSISLFSESFNGITANLGCVHCGTKGAMNVDFDIDVGFFKINSASMTIHPQDVGAFMEIGVSVQGTLTEGHTLEKNIVSIPVEGISIFKVVELGAFFDVDVGYTFGSWSGDAEITVGGEMDFSNDAVFTIDLENPDNNQISGWEPTFSAIPLQANAQVSCENTIFAKPKLAIKLEAFKIGFEASLGLDVPHIDATLTGLADTNGVCGTSQTLGIDAHASIGVDMSFDVATAADPGNPFFSKQIFDFSTDLFSTCIPFGPEGTAAPPASSSVAPPLITSTPVGTAPPVASTPAPAPVSTPAPAFSAPANGTYYRRAAEHPRAFLA